MCCCAILLVVSNSSGANAFDPPDPPDSALLQTCVDVCKNNGFCCGNRLSGEASASSHALLSCSNGCEMAYYAEDLDECKYHCGTGNAAGCDYDHPDIAGSFAMCGDCQDGCDGSTSSDECKRGCDYAHALSGFYNDVHDPDTEGPGGDRPGMHCDASPDLFTASFLANIDAGNYGRFSRSAVYDNEVFSYVSGGQNVFENSDGMFCVDGESAPQDSFKLYDDGRGGDAVKGDFVNTRGCISICPGYLESLGVKEHCYDCFGLSLLGVLSYSVYRDVYIEEITDISPEIEGCTRMHVTSHAFFATCAELMPTYPATNAWEIQLPRNCVPCRKMWDQFGDSFDFFSIRGLTHLPNAGENYVRVVDSVKGIGFDDSEVPISQYPFASNLQCPNFELDRVQGIFWGTTPGGMTHEISHWLGFNLPKLNAYTDVVNDGAHLASSCTIHGALQGPVWCWDKGYPCTIQVDEFGTDGLYLEPNDPELDGVQTFRYVSDTDLSLFMKNSKLFQYFMGLASVSDVGTEVYFCIPTNEFLNVDDSDPARIIVPNVKSFTIDDVIEAQGERDPPYPKPLHHSIDNDLRIGSIVVSDRDPSTAEMAWWTIWNRRYEDHMMDVDSSSEPSWWGWEGNGFPTFKHATDGVSIARTKLRGVPCNYKRGSVGVFESESCTSEDDPEPVYCNADRPPTINSPSQPTPSPNGSSDCKDSSSFYLSLILTVFKTV